MELDIASVKFDAQGLVPVVAQDAETGEVLMLAYADAEALSRTARERRAWFYSRSRKSYWLKGETSGNVLDVTEIRIDCDADAVLLKVRVRGDGVACHTGAKSCFFTEVEGVLDSEAPQDLVEGLPIETKNPQGHLRASSIGEVVDQLYTTILSRKDSSPDESYTSYLLNAELDKVLKKIGEEATEVVMASKDGDREHLLYEVGDLLYHTLVNCARFDIAPVDIAAELRGRFK